MERMGELSKLMGQRMKWLCQRMERMRRMGRWMKPIGQRIKRMERMSKRIERIAAVLPEREARDYLSFSIFSPELGGKQAITEILDLL